jgi:hypothetical protein
VLVNAIHRERHIVLAGAISIKNMEAGGIAYRRFRACQPKCWGEGNSWCGKQIPPLQRRHAAFWCAVFFDGKSLLHGEQPHTHEYRSTYNP